mmetsp:Transcript_16112/g.24298  ORF Transcript_16112/g.24298 Transcript_16112/m.24298 type:complete len:762 (-) Transcript_16112:175-2460(-)
MAILTNLISSGGQTTLVILVGFLFRRSGIFSKSDIAGVNKFLSYVSLPAAFFVSLALLDWSKVSFPLLGAVCVGKALMFLLVSAFMYLSSNEPERIGIVGLYSIFASQSNDIAMGVPIVNAIWGEEYSSYLYLFAPFQLLILNLIGFIAMEYNLEEREYRQRLDRAITTMSTREKKSSEIDSEENKSSTSEVKHEKKQVSIKSPRSEGETLLLDNRIEEDRVIDELPQRASPGIIAVTIMKKLSKSAVVVATLLGFVLNFAVGHNNFPPFVVDFMHILSNTYSGGALFALGLSIEGTLKAGQSILITSLVSSKVIILPLIMTLIAHLFTRNDTETEFAFIYAMLPTAPTVYIFAVTYKLKEQLMSSACLVCLLASLPFLLLSGIALEVRGSSETKTNHIGIIVANWCSWLSIISCILLGIAAFVSREFRPILGCWRIFSILVASSVVMSASELLCINDNSDVNAVAFRIFQQFTIYLTRSYGVILAVVLYSRLRKSTSYLIQMEYRGHICAWIGCATMALLHEFVPSFRPEYRKLQTDDTGYGESLLFCNVKERLGFQIFSAVVQVFLLLIALVYIMGFQSELRKQCEEKEKTNPLNNPVYGNDDDLVESGSAKYTKLNEDTKMETPLGSQSEINSMDIKSPIRGHRGFTAVNRMETCRDSTRYTLVVMLNVAGLILAFLMTLADICGLTRTAKSFTQIVFVLDVGIRLSMGLFFLGIFITHPELQLGIRTAYEKMVFSCPCLGKCTVFSRGRSSDGASLL